MTILEQSVPFIPLFKNKKRQFQRPKVLPKKTHQFHFLNEKAPGNQIIKKVNKIIIKIFFLSNRIKNLKTIHTNKVVMLLLHYNNKNVLSWTSLNGYVDFAIILAKKSNNFSIR
jgi:hypothetical protein